MQDGIVFAEFNHQGGPRGGNEFVVPNWWMGMASRDLSRGRLTFTGMLSLDPATVGKDGYREIFQAGEALNGRPLIDRQHPHDLFMQLAAVWRMPFTESTGFTLAGGPGRRARARARGVHAPGVGRGQSRRRRSVTTRSIRRTSRSASSRRPSITGRGSIEGSLFNGREPDENRWDFDFGRLDSVFRPRLVQAERRVGIAGLERSPQEPGGVGARQHRPLDRIGVMDAKERRGDFSRSPSAYGRNDTDHGAAQRVVRRGCPPLPT